MGLNHSKVKSFEFALAGIKEAFKKEPNLRIHIVIAALVLVLALILKFSPIELLILVLTVFFVIILELLNTSLESIVNLVSPEIKAEAKIAKDVSASTVLFGSIMAVVVGAVLFGSKIIGLLL